MLIVQTILLIKDYIEKRLDSVYKQYLSHIKYAKNRDISIDDKYRSLENFTDDYFDIK
ncbi:hypothetical protein NPX79_01765 [Spiroplasma endosymbiont of Anurida maritima]|uniref:hypothetical protein n=1 Tax=Spiroplasma endosymbiont of Anurida maritima TaxID=2967972 RepID=UPI0036D2D90E